jgi:hypothetical protein
MQKIKLSSFVKRRSNRLVRNTCKVSEQESRSAVAFLRNSRHSTEGGTQKRCIHKTMLDSQRMLQASTIYYGKKNETQGGACATKHLFFLSIVRFVEKRQHSCESIFVRKGPNSSNIIMPIHKTFLTHLSREGLSL